MTSTARVEAKHRATGSEKFSTSVPTNSRVAGEIAFTSDRRGDFDNLRYGSLDKKKIPRYRTAGYGRLLGLDRRFRQIAVSDTKREVEDETTDSARVKRTSSLLGADLSVSNEPIRLFASQQNDEPFEEQSDFVGFEPRNSRKRRKLTPEVTRTNHASLVLHGCTDEASSTSEDEQTSDIVASAGYSIDQDSFEIFRNHPHNQKQIELTKTTDSDPEDVGAWLALIDHQELYHRLLTPDDGRLLTAGERQSIADMKVSLYQKALSRVRNSAARDRLLIGLMMEGSNYWDTNQQSTEWQAALKQSTSFNLLYPFLEFQQSNPIIFSYDKTLQHYVSALRRARKLSFAEDSDRHTVNVILRLTAFMDQCGFTERAVAIWQALLELNLCQRLTTTGVETIESFKDFWDAEAPRIGEESITAKTAEVPQPQTGADLPLQAFRKSFVFEDWSLDENERSKRNTLPARTLDDTLEDDPYRVIMWADIEDFVTSMKTNMGKELLLQAYLRFSNLPPLYQDTVYPLHWRQNVSLSYPAFETHSGEENAVTTLTDEIDLQFVLPNTSMLFARAAPSASMWNFISATPSPLIQMTSRILGALVEYVPEDDELAEYSVALQYHVNPAHAAKYVKRLLKKRPGCVRLYNAHALMEAQNGRLNVASNVWSISLSMLSGHNPESQQHTVLLWHSWMWELLRVKRWNSVLHMILHALPSGTTQKYTPVPEDHVVDLNETQIIIARSYMNAAVTRALKAGNTRTAAMYTDLTAILQYLVNNHNLTEAAQSYSSILASLDNSKDAVTIELIHQHRAMLLHFHSHSSPSGHRPAQLVSILHQSHLLFPNNSLFHSLYEHFSRRAGTIDRLRRVNTHAVNPSTGLHLQINTTTENPHEINKSIIPTLLALSSTLSRPAYAGSTTHLIRSSFKSATSPSSPARHAPRLWQAWLTWELSLLQSQPPSLSFSPSPSVSLTTHASKNLKSLLLSSLNACPWSKELYMQAFLHPVMREALGHKVLAEVYKTMLERGVRVRVDIEDLLDEVDEGGSEGDGDGDGDVA